MKKLILFILIGFGQISFGQFELRYLDHETYVPPEVVDQLLDENRLESFIQFLDNYGANKDPVITGEQGQSVSSSHEEGESCNDGEGFIYKSGSGVIIKKFLYQNSGGKQHYIYIDENNDRMERASFHENGELFIRAFRKEGSAYSAMFDEDGEIQKLTKH